MQPMVGLVEAWVEELGGTKILVEVEGTLVVSLVAMGTMMMLIEIWVASNLGFLHFWAKLIQRHIWSGKRELTLSLIATTFQRRKR